MSEVIVRYSDNGYGNVSGEIVGELVRCKECKFSARYVDDGHIEYRLYSHPLRHDYHEMKPDDYCSYGERREP